MVRIFLCAGAAAAALLLTHAILAQPAGPSFPDGVLAVGGAVLPSNDPVNQQSRAFAGRVDVADGRAVVLAEGAGPPTRNTLGDAILFVLDADPHQPRVLGSHVLPGTLGRDVVAGGRHAYALALDYGEGTRVRVFATSTGTPVEVAAVSVPGGTDLALAGDRLYVTRSWSAGPGTLEYGVEVLDVADPARPTSLGSARWPYREDGFAELVEVAHPYAYVVQGGISTGVQQLHVYDVADPTRPLRLGSVDVGMVPRALAAAGGKVYLAGWTPGYDAAALAVVDASDPRAARILGAPGTPYGPPGSRLSFGDVEVAPPLAAVAAGEAGVWVFDVADPAVPRVRQISPAVKGAHLALGDRALFVAAVEGGLVGLRFPEPVFRRVLPWVGQHAGT